MSISSGKFYGSIRLIMLIGLCIIMVSVVELIGVVLL